MTNLLHTPLPNALAVIRAQTMAEQAPPAREPRRCNVPQEEILKFLSAHEGPVLVTKIEKGLKADKEWLRTRLRRMVQVGLLQPHSVSRNGRLAYTIKQKPKSSK